jgi:hypothetical protein
VKGERAREANERLGLVTLGQGLERRVEANSVGLGDGERRAASGERR